MSELRPIYQKLVFIFDNVHNLFKKQNLTGSFLIPYNKR